MLTNGEDGFDPNKSTEGSSLADEPNNTSSPNKDKPPTFDYTNNEIIHCWLATLLSSMNILATPTNIVHLIYMSSLIPLIIIIALQYHSKHNAHGL